MTHRPKRTLWMKNHKPKFRIPIVVLKSYDIMNHLCEKHLIGGATDQEGNWDALEDFLGFDLRTIKEQEDDKRTKQ